MDASALTPSVRDMYVTRLADSKKISYLGIIFTQIIWVPICLIVMSWLMSKGWTWWQAKAPNFTTKYSDILHFIGDAYLFGLMVFGFAAPIWEERNNRINRILQFNSCDDQMLHALYEENRTQSHNNRIVGAIFGAVILLIIAYLLFK